MNKFNKYIYKIIPASLLFIYFLYVCAFHFIPELAMYNNSMKDKGNIIISPPCIVIIGGSNVVYGISAKQFQNYFGCVSYNLGISPGGEGTSRLYFRWLSQLKLHPDIILYSPVEILSSKKIDELYYPLSIMPNDILPRVSLASLLRGIFFYKKDKFFDSYGDIIRYPDSTFIKTDENKFKINEFNNANKVNVNNIIKKIKFLCSNFSKSKIILVVPPRHMDSSLREIFKIAVSNRLDLIKVDECHFEVLKNTLDYNLSSEKLFFDNNHLNSAGREKLTKYLISDIAELTNQ